MNFIGFIVVGIITWCFCAFAFSQIIGSLFILIPNKEKIGTFTLIIWSLLTILFYYLMFKFALEYKPVIIVISCINAISIFSNIKKFKIEYQQKKDDE